MAQISSKCDKFYYDNYNSKYYVPELFDSTVYLILNKLNFQSVPTLQQIYVFFNNILPFNISIKTLNYIRTQLENNEIPLLSFRDFINWVGRDFITNYYENKKNDVDTDMKRAIWNLYELVETKYLIIKKMEKIEKELEDALGEHV